MKAAMIGVTVATLATLLVMGCAAGVLYFLAWLMEGE